MQAELVETVATIAYSDTTNPSGQLARDVANRETFVGALDRLYLITAVRLDPDLRIIFEPSLERESAL